MTEPKHTPEPWGYVERVSGSENHRGYRVYGPDGYYVAEIYPIDEDGIKGKEIARRIVACVNALEGVPTEVLEGPRETYTYGPGHEPHVWNIYGADKETSEIGCVGEDTAQMVCRALNLYGEESEKS